MREALETYRRMERIARLYLAQTLAKAGRRLNPDQMKTVARMFLEKDADRLRAVARRQLEVEKELARSIRV
jgi:hypothetical protein